jgi:N-alpha-acetyl-L-2,4-diaminobutyrate deacetylase
MVPSWSPVTTTVDFDLPGRQIGRVVMPLPGMAETVDTPIAVFNGGAGPTVLLSGALHGDEYDGPITLSNLVRTLDVAKVRGRLIVIPFVNQLAMRAAQRVSPLDQLDLNRSFPGDPSGRPSEILAHWIATRIVPLVDAVVDSHTGGTKTSWIPLVMMHPVADAAQHGRMLELVRAMRAPLGIVLNETDKPGMFDTFVENQGKVFVCCEYGGGTLTRATLDVAGVCIRNALRHFGMLDGEPETPVWDAFDGPRIMECLDLEWAVAAERDGIYEPRVELGQTVEAGDLLGVIHPMDDLGIDPVPVRAPVAGTLFFRPASSRVETGRRLGMIARDL